MTEYSHSRPMDDVIKTPKTHLQLGDCGMGMPVIRTWQAIRKVNVGEIVLVSSSHP